MHPSSNPSKIGGFEDNPSTTTWKQIAGIAGGFAKTILGNGEAMRPCASTMASQQFFGRLCTPLSTACCCPAASGDSAAAKLMVLAVAIFMDACIKGFKNKAFVGYLMLTNWKWVVSWSSMVFFRLSNHLRCRRNLFWWLRILNTSMRVPETMMAELSVIYLSRIDFCILKIIAEGVWNGYIPKRMFSAEDYCHGYKTGANRWCVS